ncbi:MAG: Single-stranded-DNA-specific exonuclease RecJ [Candidatus Dependentiae bacterium ADurb.Bin331]|nr:MAG: Single-stranded-DNA-specific exonuclease RecJ [Candidatus Dependentiae bacterium ADurb.Bin331]
MTTMQGKKYQWKLPVINNHDALQIASSYNISLPLAWTLLSRGLSTKELIDRYLMSVKERDVTHPSQMKDTSKAVDRIIQAVRNNEKILIFGDYDVDGITSSALMMLCMVPLNAHINFFLPNRVRDGYGLSVSIIERAAKNGYKVVITVDNGVTAFEPAKRARELGIDLIITDHHRPHDHLPESYALINPHQKECSYPYKFFAGVGVTFKLMSLLYEQLDRELPDKVYELLLLGTVADVVPLTGENRFWVRHCLTRVNAGHSFALKVLKENGKMSKEYISASDIGFALAPQINALGRLEDPREGVKFLIGSDEQEVAYVGQILAELNQARKEIERAILSEIINEVEQKRINLDTESIILAASDQWPPGVIGLIASRLVGAYHRPAILLHITKEGIAKGSCRSIGAFNMFEALAKCSDLLLSFGGHAVAAGLSLAVENLPALKERLEKLLAQEVGADDLIPTVTIDAPLRLGDLTKKIVTDLAFFEPFGNENPQPTFYVERVTLVQQPLLLKDAHVKCLFFADGIAKPIIFFNRPEIFQFLVDNSNDYFDIVAHINENNWQGKISIELIGIDIARSVEK